MLRIILPALAGIAFAMPGAALAKYKGSKAELSARKKGRKLIRELRLDIDGDGRKEIGAVEREGDSLRLVVFKPTGDEERSGGYERIGQSSPRVASRVVRFEAKRIAGRSPKELLAVFETPSPDETALSVRIMSAAGKGVEEIFAHTFFVPGKSAKTDPSEVRFGDASPHFLVEKSDEKQGDAKIVWVREPQVLKVEGPKGPVRFVIGAHRTIFKYSREKRRYDRDTKDIVDFLQTKPFDTVEASTQVAKVWGTAQPFWGADGNLDTSWNVPIKSAKGQTLNVKFKRTVDINMVRLVPGCAKSEEDWSKHGELQRFRLLLSSGRRVEIDRTDLLNVPRAVRAAGEFPLGPGYGTQLLVFFTETQPVRWVRLEILSASKSALPRRKRVNEVCLSEISFH